MAGRLLREVALLAAVPVAGVGVVALLLGHGDDAVAVAGPTPVATASRTGSGPLTLDVAEPGHYQLRVRLTAGTAPCKLAAVRAVDPSGTLISGDSLLDAEPGTTSREDVVLLEDPDRSGAQEVDLVLSSPGCVATVRLVPARSAGIRAGPHVVKR